MATQNQEKNTQESDWDFPIFIIAGFLIGLFSICTSFWPDDDE